MSVMSRMANANIFRGSIDGLVCRPKLLDMPACSLKVNKRWRLKLVVMSCQKFKLDSFLYIREWVMGACQCAYQPGNISRRNEKRHGAENPHLKFACQARMAK